MSHIRWIPPPAPGSSEPARSAWRFFPWLVVAGMSVVVTVNAAMIYAALASFPGKAGDEGFALSNHYNAVLDRERRETLLGWTMSARTNATGRPEVTLTDRLGSPLQEASVGASARRPLGAPEARELSFHETAPGYYVSDTVLASPGQWDLTLMISASGHQVAATRRVIVR